MGKETKKSRDFEMPIPAFLSDAEAAKEFLRQLKKDGFNMDWQANFHEPMGNPLTGELVLTMEQIFQLEALQQQMEEMEDFDACEFTLFLCRHREMETLALITDPGSDQETIKPIKFQAYQTQSIREEFIILN